MIYAYLRVSTKSQGESGLGLDAQLEVINREFDVPAENRYTDVASGKTAKRPHLMEVLDLLEPGDVLAVAKRDRLARDVALAIWIEQQVRKAGATIWSSDASDDDDPTARMIRQILDVFSEFEGALISARTKAAHERRRANGLKCGGDVPYGFRVEGEKVVEDEDEKQAIEAVKHLRLKSLSLREISGELKRMGYLSRAGNGFHPEQIKRMLA